MVFTIVSAETLWDRSVSPPRPATLNIEMQGIPEGERVELVIDSPGPGGAAFTKLYVAPPSGIISDSIAIPPGLANRFGMSGTWKNEGSERFTLATNCRVIVYGATQMEIRCVA